MMSRTGPSVFVLAGVPGFLRKNDPDADGMPWLAVAVDERGLDALLGLPLGLNDAANGLGRNSWLFGLSFPRRAVALVRRGAAASGPCAGPVGGWRTSVPGAGGARPFLFCSIFLSLADKEGAGCPCWELETWERVERSCRNGWLLW
jgi:hypothetical protein